MNLYLAGTAIKQRWMTQWASVGAGVPYVFDNDVQSEGVPAYIRVQVEPTTRTQETQGAFPKYRQNATITVQLNYKSGDGTKTIDLATPAALAVFRGKRFGGVGDESIICFQSTAEKPTNDGQYYRRRFTIPCWWTE